MVALAVAISVLIAAASIWIRCHHCCVCASGSAVVFVFVCVCYKWLLLFLLPQVISRYRNTFDGFDLAFHELVSVHPLPLHHLLSRPSLSEPAPLPEVLEPVGVAPLPTLWDGAVRIGTALAAGATADSDSRHQQLPHCGADGSERRHRQWRRWGRQWPVDPDDQEGEHQSEGDTASDAEAGHRPDGVPVPRSVAAVLRRVTARGANYSSARLHCAWCRIAVCVSWLLIPGFTS